MLLRRRQTLRIFTVLRTVVLIARIWTGLSGSSFVIYVVFVFCEMVILHYEFQVLDSVAVIPVEATFRVCCLYTNTFCEATASLN